MTELKKQIESLLFSSGRKMLVEEIAKLCNAREEQVLQALQLLMSDHGDNRSTMLINEGNAWKLTVKEDYLPLVSKIVTETELSKTIMETLAVIAFRYPIKQSDLIKIRTNKAYEHLSELEQMGYISRQKYGRTKLIKLTQKFFEYFSLTEEKLKEQFQDFSSIAKAVEKKEQEIKALKEEQKKKAGTIKEEKTGDLIDVDDLDKEEADKEEAVELNLPGTYNVKE